MVGIEFKPILDDLLYKLSDITQRHHQFRVVGHLSHNRLEVLLLPEELYRFILLIIFELRNVDSL